MAFVIVLSLPCLAQILSSSALCLKLGHPRDPSDPQCAPTLVASRDCTATMSLTVLANDRLVEVDVAEVAAGHDPQSRPVTVTRPERPFDGTEGFGYDGYLPLSALAKRRRLPTADPAPQRTPDSADRGRRRHRRRQVAVTDADGDYIYTATTIVTGCFDYEFVCECGSNETLSLSLRRSNARAYLRRYTPRCRFCHSVFSEVV